MIFKRRIATTAYICRSPWGLAALNGMPFKYLTICHLHMTVPAHRLLQFLVAMSHVNERKEGVPLIMQALFLNAKFWVV